MQLLKILIVGFVLFFTSCYKMDRDLPECINQQIKESKSGNNFVGSIYEYKLDKEIFYILDQNYNCYDCFQSLVDSNCKLICGISGGISGKGSLDCPDWVNKATFESTLIWKRE